MKKHGKIAFVPSELFEFGLEEKRLTPTDAIIWLFLIYRSGRNGKVWVSNVTIANNCGITRQTVISSITRLKAGGWLSVDGTTRIVNLKKLDELVAEEAFREIAQKVNDPSKSLQSDVKPLDSRREILDTGCENFRHNNKHVQTNNKLIITDPPEVGSEKSLFNSKEKIETRFKEIKALKAKAVIDFQFIRDPTQQQFDDQNKRYQAWADEVDQLEAAYVIILMEARR